jgi:hypothetical protein
MMSFRRFAALTALLAVSACAGGPNGPLPYQPAVDGWIPAMATTRAVGLGLPGGAALAQDVSFAGGLELVVDTASPLHSLSDLKLTGPGGGFVSVSDSGDLARGRILLDASGRLTGLEGLAFRRLTLEDGQPIQDKADGDAEGLALLPDGRLLVSFERRHRIWSYGRLPGLDARPTPVRSPDFAFTENDGMEGMAARHAGGGWRATGENGGVWDCAPAGCTVVQTPPVPPLSDRDYRITGMDRDPSGDGWFVVQRSFAPPVDARARVRRMGPDGALGPVLVELKLPGTTDNFEGIAAETRNGRTRLYILSDDNNNPAQRTLMLAFDVMPGR